ncbi:MAG: histidine kinase [Leucobacter sp.]
MRFQTWMRESPAARDIGLAALWAVLGLVCFAFGAYPLWGSLVVFDAAPWVFILTLAGITAAATQRSKRPFVALTAGVVIAVIDVLCGGSLGVVIALTDLVYAAVKYGRDRFVRALFRFALMLVLATGVALALVRVTNLDLIVALVQWSLILLVSGLWGWNVRSEGKRMRGVLVEQHASETRLLRERIAHDLHDLVANHIAVAGLHVEAAKLQAAGGLGGALTLSLDRAKHGTDSAHRELRSLIAVLTAVDELDSPAPLRLSVELEEIAALLPGERTLLWSAGTRDVITEVLAHDGDPRARVMLRGLRELIANAAKHGVGDVSVNATTEADLVLFVRNTNAHHAYSSDRDLGSGLGVGGTRLLLRGIGGELETYADGEIWVAKLTLPSAGERVAAGRTASLSPPKIEGHS